MSKETVTGKKVWRILIVWCGDDYKAVECLAMYICIYSASIAQGHLTVSFASMKLLEW